MRRLSFNRKRLSLIVYIAAITGTVALAFVCVWLSRLMFDRQEKDLYDRETYVAVNIVSAENVGQPLKLKTRALLFADCAIEGEPRKRLPDELLQTDAEHTALRLWSQILSSAAAGTGALPSGDIVDVLMGEAKTTCVLRDYTNPDSGAKYSMWCAQVFCDSEGGETYCLSVIMDSRTGQPLYLSCALYENVSEANPLCGFTAMLEALGHGELDIKSAQKQGDELVLPLEDGLNLVKHNEYGSQFIFELAVTDAGV